MAVSHSSSPPETVAEEAHEPTKTSLFSALFAFLKRRTSRITIHRRSFEREVALRQRLQTAYEEQKNLVQQLTETYSEQEILVLQQQELLEEVNRLYHEQARAATTDAVTGLPNHRAVMSCIEEEVKDCQRTQRAFAILFVDLDHFKRINDTWGHRAGDAILREVAQRLHAALRLEDVVGRYGGEEFAIVLSNIDLDEATTIAERLRTAVQAEPCMWQMEESSSLVPITVTASMGIALYGRHGRTREALIEAADQAMYQAKHNGRNRVCVAEEEVQGLLPPGSADIATKGTGSELVAVQALTAVALAHDRGTDAHAHRMVRLAEATAGKLGRSEEELHLVRLAALLHDIGKIGIPDAILHKPGPLTEDEWGVMRRHPEIGRQILEQTGGIFQCLAHIVATHHERWDGSGYPLGLAREEIPLSARILAVVDSYDAMTSDRVYRQALSDEQARAELQRCAGSQYDPEVVQAFLNVLDEQKSACVHQSQDVILAPN